MQGQGGDVAATSGSGGASVAPTACIHFLSGRCRFGDRCRAGVHDPSAEELQEEWRREDQLYASSSGNSYGSRSGSGGGNGSESSFEEAGALEEGAPLVGGGAAGAAASAAGGEAAQQRQRRREERGVRRAAERQQRQQNRKAAEQVPPLPEVLVTDEFKELCWCEPCRLTCPTPKALLIHCQQEHPGSPRIEALQAARACPCGRTFTSLSGLSSHVKSVHGGPTPGQRQGDTMLRVMMAPGGVLARELAGGGGGGGGGWGGWGGGWDSDDSGGMLGFSGEQVHELLCQGVKPWEDDAFDVMDALYDMHGEYDDDY
ncbi:F-box 8 [Micractinium conductrix]|uniref:F-box 8 n=1 Tax=Micractinium conductrix TaxID=554055 RepID=A0A2P6V2Y5_9CHLO|nr:F-box 8 [Micractinium conductrix]|eukprot:PSC68441.1 F-box 8 [Micractinium conductrix]